MPSQVQICNLALRRVGEKTIMAFTDQTKAGNICRDIYIQIYDEVLCSHNWNCAIQRAELAENSETPPFEWAHSFALPDSPKCLRVIEMEDPESIFKIEGRNLLTDEGACKIKYIKRVENPLELHPLFVKVFYLELAVSMAYNLTETNTVKKGLIEEVKDAWSNARSMDALEGDPDPTMFSSWLQSRVAGYTSKYRGSYSGRW